MGKAGQWAILVPASLALAWLLNAAGLPAAFLLGPMIVGLLIGANGGTIRMPVMLYRAAQTVIACMIVRSLTPSIFEEFLADGLLFMSVIVILLVASGAVGLFLTHLQIFPGTTALWGCWPGGASAMVLMAEEYGGDQQLVAFMQYLRVVLVSLTAGAVAFFWAAPVDAGAAAGPDWLAPVRWGAFLLTLAFCAVSLALALRIKMGGAAFILPLFAGLALKLTGVLDIELPAPLTSLSFIVLGWYIGLGFTRKTLYHAWRTLPQVLGSVILLMVLSAALAYAMHRLSNIDLFTAFLATSPGGLDTIAIIAATTNSDVSFVLTLHLMRLLILLTIGPYLARLLMLKHKPPKDTPPTPMD
jgi:membrane AbrB-like protein